MLSLLHISRVLWAALVYATAAGGLACTAVWYFGDFFADKVFMTPFCVYALKTLAPTIWVMAYLGVLRGYFQGHGTMVPTAFSQIFEQVVNAVISVTAVSYTYLDVYKRQTSNRMELMAAIAGLEALNRPCQVELYSDSKYLVDAFNKHWLDGWIKKGWKRGKNEPVKNVDLWKRLLEAARPHQIAFIWVKGHNGHPENERCDFLATSAADGKNLLDDPGI